MFFRPKRRGRDALRLRATSTALEEVAAPQAAAAEEPRVEAQGEAHYDHVQ